RRGKEGQRRRVPGTGAAACARGGLGALKIQRQTSRNCTTAGAQAPWGVPLTSGQGYDDRGGASWPRARRTRQRTGRSGSLLRSVPGPVAWGPERILPFSGVGGDSTERRQPPAQWRRREVSPSGAGREERGAFARVGRTRVGGGADSAENRPCAVRPSVRPSCPPHHARPERSPRGGGGRLRGKGGGAAGGGAAGGGAGGRALLPWAQRDSLRAPPPHSQGLLLALLMPSLLRFLRPAASAVASSSAAAMATASSPLSAAFVTCPNQTVARDIARAAVEKRLVACVNIVPGITSIYEWKGKIEEDSEVLLMMKTRSSRISALAEFVRSVHPYEVAEVIAVPIEQGNPPYLKWVEETVPE
uniref:CutA divalent cation tolerance homolog n=1 Tax=Salvator merianae TaxID=96440 RepID=A0A8D0C4Z6_SALMN